MTSPSSVFKAIPAALRTPLIEEHRRIVQSFMERKWLPSELSGGRFCEIVYTILDGHAKGSYPNKLTKPPNFVQACRNLENNVNVPRSFQILIPRMLPALYEIRNNRGVGHVGGDVDPNYMDASAVVSMADWILAEFARVFHGLSIADAQMFVNSMVERRIPLIWTNGDVKRVLKVDLPLKDQVLLLIASCPNGSDTNDLFKWVEYKNRAYFNRLLRQLHKERLAELDENASYISLLPPGAKYVDEHMRRNN